MPDNAGRFRTSELEQLKAKMPAAALEAFERYAAMSPEEQTEEDARIAKRDLERRTELEQQTCPERAGLTGDMLKDTFAAYKPAHPTQASALRLCCLFVQHYPKVNRKGFLLHGPVGVGKSHLLRGTVIELAKKNPLPSVRYWYVPEIMRVLWREKNQRAEFKDTSVIPPDTEQDMLACDALMLDDLGKLDASAQGAWFVNLIGVVIDKAEREGRPIICATANDLGGESALQLIEKNVGPAFASRLRALMWPCEVLGPDARDTEEAPWWAR